MSSGKPKCFAQQFIGIRADQKCPTLFSFKDVGAEWPSDDSNDSDYEVGDSKKRQSSSPKPNCKVSLAPEDLNDNHNSKERPIKLIFSNCVPKKKISRRRKSKDEDPDGAKKRKRQRKNKIISEGTNVASDATNEVYHSKWSHEMPRELLLAIFKLVIRSEGIAPFLPRVSRVCKLWNEVANDSMLWVKADLSSGRVKRSEELLKWLCINRLSQTKELNMSGWGKSVTSSGFQAISNHCPNLKSINMSRCSKLTNVGIRSLIDNCKNLSSFDLTAVTECNGSSQFSPVSTSTLTYLIEQCGSNLKELFLANNHLLSPHALLTDLYSKCSSLTVLDLSNILPEGKIVTISLEKLQSGCPKLQVLRLANTIVQLANATLVEQNAAPGFPELEELSIAVCKTSAWVGLNESSLERIVKNSKKLRLLDVRGCSHTASSLVRIPAWDIEHLFLSRCESTKRQGLELIIQKWCHSLVVLDLSWNTSPVETIDQAVMALASVGEKSMMQELDLHGSTVSFAPIQELLKNCPRLRVLDLSSCRGLPRGIKRLYPSKDDIDVLRRDILTE